LRDRFNKPLVDGSSAHGRDAYCALEAYFALFATLLGSSTYDLHSFNPPTGGFQSVKLSQMRPNAPFTLSYQFYLILGDAPDIRSAILPHLEGLFFLPRFLVLRRDMSSEAMTYPDAVIRLPEPMDYLVAKGDMSKVATAVIYELFAMVCYMGPNADHAIVLAKAADTKTLWAFDDQGVREKGDDSCLKKGEGAFLCTSFNWPSLLFYCKGET
jgi:hypothetical protein